MHLLNLWRINPQEKKPHTYIWIFYRDKEYKGQDTLYPENDQKFKINRCFAAPFYNTGALETTKP